MNRGDAISIPELATFKPRSSREIKTGSLLETEETGKYVTGARMILFLKRQTTPAANKNQIDNDAISSITWRPADDAGFNVSVVWVEGTDTYAFQQLMNPGPSLLTEYRIAEPEIKDRSLEVIGVQNSVNETLTISDCLKKSEALERFVTSPLYYARDVAFAEMQKCGEPALPVLRKMLTDQSLLSVHSEVIASMAKVAGEKIGDELTQLVKVELEFWKATGPILKEGWWNKIEDPETEILRNRYSRMYTALSSLKKLRFDGCRETVIELRDFWRSLPQLDDKGGLNQISEECDKILSALE